MFDRLKSVGHFEVTNEELMECRNIFSAVSVNEDKTLGTIANVFEKHGYLLCPHSAVGFAAAEAYLVKYPNQRVVTLATAHIGKFTEHILANIQYGTNKEKSERFRTAVVNSVPEKLRLLEKSETRRIDIDNSVEDIKEFLIKHVVH
jgi:threonine synthase